MQPLADRVIVRPIPESQVRASGLVLATTEKPQRGTVLSIGTGTVTKKGVRLMPDVAEQDVVIYGKFSGTEIKVDGEDLVVLKESDILAREES